MGSGWCLPIRPFVIVPQIVHACAWAHGSWGFKAHQGNDHVSFYVWDLLILLMHRLSSPIIDRWGYVCCSTASHIVEDCSNCALARWAERLLALSVLGERCMVHDVRTRRYRTVSRLTRTTTICCCLLGSCFFSLRLTFDSAHMLFLVEKSACECCKARLSHPRGMIFDAARTLTFSYRL
jgi:hypothetical protein